jgi:hypothetical protein
MVLTQESCNAMWIAPRPDCVKVETSGIAALDAVRARCKRLGITNAEKSALVPEQNQHQEIEEGTEEDLCNEGDRAGVINL